MTLYKVLDGVTPVNGGTGRYPGVGRWTRHLDPDRLDPCRYGFHLADGEVQLLSWLGPTIYVAEPCPDHPPVEAGGKLVTCRVRLVERTCWDDRVARRFAADCAESALLGERACGREPDRRSWDAVRVARRFGDGVVSRAELVAAGAAAWAAAGDAARAAALAAAGDAAWAAARDAAWAAAGDAAWAAARAAAGDAAWAAARDAAWAAAWAAARDSLGGRLATHLSGDDPGPVTALYTPQGVTS